MVEVEITQKIFDEVHAVFKDLQLIDPKGIQLWIDIVYDIKLTEQQIQLILNSPDMSTMTNKQTAERRKKITKVFQDLLTGLPIVTSLEVKNVLRKYYTTENWEQKHVSKVLQSIYENGEINDLQFNDNGTYREYYLWNKQAANTVQRIVNGLPKSQVATVTTPPTPKKLHVFETNTGSRFQGTAEEIKKIAAVLGFEVHYSESKDEFYNLNSLPKTYLRNIILKEVSKLVEAKDVDALVEFVENSKYIDQWNEKYSLTDDEEEGE